MYEDEQCHVYFPFIWSVKDDKSEFEASDGKGGPPVTNPLELRVVEHETDEVIFTVDLANEIMEDADCIGCYPDGCVDGQSREWAGKMAEALERVAAELRRRASLTRAAHEVSDRE